jgi:hypothetical protein
LTLNGFAVLKSNEKLVNEAQLRFGSWNQALREAGIDNPS